MAFAISGSGTKGSLIIPPFSIEITYTNYKGTGVNWGESKASYLAIAKIPEFEHGEWRKILRKFQLNLGDLTAADVLAWEFFNPIASDAAFFHARKLVTGKGGEMIQIPRLRPSSEKVDPKVVDAFLDTVDEIAEYRHLHSRERGRYDYEVKWNASPARKLKHREQIKSLFA